MGLDITVHTKVEAVAADELPPGDRWDLLTQHGIVRVHVDRAFAWSQRGLPVDPEHGGWVRSVGQRWDFRAGSYSGYNAFRRSLCRLALGVLPQVVWSDPDHYRDSPFYELVNFSDCEGTIGSTAAADLAADFDTFTDQVEQQWQGNLSLYRTWCSACHDAAGEGMIVFH